MKKRIISCLLVLVILTTIAALLSGCGIFSSKLSGVYKSQTSESYLEFYDRRGVLLHIPNSYPLEGDYDVDGNKVILSLNMGGYYTDHVFSLSRDKRTISAVIDEGSIVFVKESGITKNGSSKLPWWGWAIIILIVVGIANGVKDSARKKS